ncbi:MAG TPA: ABC transporter permease subunit [Planctomycetota bacterium]|nr:ABC transporter permease subunit [Planctomycetota bacterium]
MTTAAITSNTFREAVRQPVYWAIILLTAVLMCLSVVFVGFALGEESKFVRDAGLTSITIAGLLMAMFLSSSVVADEIEKKTALSVLCKPVGRSEFIFGKFLGIVLAIIAGYIILTLLFLVTVWWFESQVQYLMLFKFYGQPLNARWISTDFFIDSPLHGQPITLSMIASLFWSDVSGFVVSPLPNLAKGVALSLCEVTVLAAAALAVSTRLSMIFNACLTLGLFILGHQIGYLVHSLTGSQTALGAKIVLAIVPNFELLNYASDIAFDKVVPMHLVGFLALYTVGWIGVFLLAAIALFDQREIA